MWTGAKFEYTKLVIKYLVWIKTKISKITLLIVKVYKNCYVCYKSSEIDEQGIHMNFRGYKNPITDEACFYPKHKSQFLPSPENQFASGLFLKLVSLDLKIK